MSGRKRRVVVVGLGYAGAAAARALALEGSGRLEVLALNPKPHLYNYPALPRLLNELAPDERVNVPLDKIFRGPTVEFHRERVTSVDARRRVVAGESLEFEFDYLVLAMGGRAVPIDQEEDAPVFYPKSLRHLQRLLTCLRAAAEARRVEPRRFAVVGGGLTGVEFSAALSHARDDICAAAGVSTGEIEIHLLERREEIAAELPARAGRKIAEYLEGRGVRIHRGVKVERIMSNGELVTGPGGVTPADAAVCCIGARPNTRVEFIGVSLNGGALCVNEFLQVSGHHNIFAAGDNITLENGGRPPWLLRASHAERQGRLACLNILRHMYGRPLNRYTPRAGAPAVYLGYKTSAIVWRDRAVIGGWLDTVKRYLEGRIA